MSISDNYAPDVNLCNGVTTSFTGDWKVLNASYFRFALEDVATGAQTLLTQGSDYTLTFGETGYEAVTAVAYPSTKKAVRYRDVSLDQTDPYRTSKGFQGRVIENSFDKLTAIEQDQNDQIGRSPKFRIGSSASSFVIDDPIDGRALKFDTVNGKIVNSDSDFDTVVAEAEAARDAASASAGVASASEAAAQAAQAAAEAAAAAAESNVISDAMEPVCSAATLAAARSALGLGTMAVEAASSYLTTTHAATTYATKTELATAVPSQTGNSGKFLTTNGTTSSWGSVALPPVKAWANWTAGGTTVNGSLNVSSVTRAIAGDYTVNFTTALPHANYAVIGSTATTTGTAYLVNQHAGTEPTTTSCRILITQSWTGSIADPSTNKISAAFIG